MTPPRYTVSAALAPGALAGLCVLVLGALAWPYTVDDAFIVARYARNLARGLGYAMNPGAPSDGVTGPLWLLPQWLAIRAGLEPIAVAKALGLFGAALGAGTVAARLRARAGGRRIAWLAAIACAISPSLGTWGASGLETGAATCLVALGALAATARPEPRPQWLGTSVALLAWLRPEFAFACAALLCGAWLRNRRAGAIAGAIALAGVASVVAFRLALFGHALPMSFAAKAGTLGDGVEYTLRSVLLATSGVGAALAARGAIVGRRDDRVIGAALLAHLLAVLLAGGDWMPGYRLLVPVLPLYAWLLAVGVARRRGHGSQTVLALASFALALLVPALDLATRVPDLRAAGASQARTAELGAFLRSRARRVALVDVGHLGYVTDLPVVDLGGLTDPGIAAMPGGHLDKRVDWSSLRERDPDAIVLHAARPPVLGEGGELLGLDGYPVERRVARMPEVRTRFRVVHQHVHAPGYLYVVLLPVTARSER